MNLHTVADPGIGIVVSTERCTASRKSAGFVRHIAIDVSNTKLAGNFATGQSFGVIAPGVDSRGQPHKLRLYSISSPTEGEDGNGRVLATTVKRLIDEHHETHRLFLGITSNWLCDLEPGDEVPVTGPSGKRFVLPADPNEHDYIFLATGTGIAPFRGMIAELLKSGATSRIVLISGSPYATDLPYHDAFLSLAHQHSNFHYFTALSREKQPDGKPMMYVQDRLVAQRDELLPMLASPRTLVYICGIAGMELGILQSLAHVAPADVCQHYINVDPAASDPKTWERRMLHKQVRPTRRVFVEVY